MTSDDKLAAAIGQAIRDRREALDMKQTQLANAIGRRQQHVGSIEDGRWLPRISMLREISAVLGYSLAALIEEAEHILSGDEP